MKPIYFPFTFISEPVLKEISMFFPQTIIYQPSPSRIPNFIQKSAEEGLLEIRAFFEGDDARFERLVKEYKDWLEHHKGSETTFFKSRIFDGADVDSIPMYSDSSTSQIKHDIKKGYIEKKAQKPDVEFTARLFLIIAQEFDIQQNEFSQDLKHFELMESNLFSNIRGEDELAEIRTGIVDKSAFEDLGKYKTGQRISAWLRVFEQDPVVPDEFGSLLLLTSSRAVLENVMEICPDGQLVFSTSPIQVESHQPADIKKYHENLRENLMRLSREGLEKEPTDSKALTATKDNAFPCLKIFCFQHRSLGALLGEPQRKSDGISKNIGLPAYPKIFIGIIERMQP